MISKNICKVFYVGRDKNNLSSIGSFEIDLRNPKRILNISKSPLLGLGSLGHFDDCAVLPSQIFKFKKILHVLHWLDTRCKSSLYGCFRFSFK